MTSDNQSASDEFRRDHYSQLFDRNEKAQSHRWTFLQLSLAAAFAFYAAVIANSILPEPWQKAFAGLIPIAFAILGLKHAKALRAGMKERGMVMRQIEDYFNVVGWQRFRANKRETAMSEDGVSLEEAEKLTLGLATITYTYWRLMIALTVIVEIVLAGWALMTLFHTMCGAKP